MFWKALINDVLVEKMNRFLFTDVPTVISIFRQSNDFPANRQTDCVKMQLMQLHVYLKLEPGQHP